MKFKLVENYNDYALDDLLDLVQEYIYDAVDKLKGAPLETYLEWFKEQLSEYDDLTAEDIETVVTNVYIEAIDCGKIKRPKTMITSQLKDYIESNADLIDKDIDELIDNCPEHLRHELQLALDVAELNESLNEDLLTEKLWVRLEDNIKPNPFYFYTTNKNITSDINTLIDVISRSGSGTYKQQLDQDILKELRANYATALRSGVTYTLTPIKPKIAVTDDELSANKTRIITLTDRSLRREAEKNVLVSTGLSPKEWLVHHKVKGEEDNILTNIALISRNSASRLDDAVAHAVHKILENQGNPGGAITTATFRVDIKENIAGTWVNTHTVDITIR